MHYGQLARVFGALLIFLMCDYSCADDKFELGDAELDLVTAGAQTSDNKIFMIDFSKSTNSGKAVSGEGSLEILHTLLSASTNTIYLGDNAQGNLRSLININAINSQISVLLNLNINIDSSIDSLNQLNISSATPPIKLPNH